MRSLEPLWHRDPMTAANIFIGSQAMYRISDEVGAASSGVQTRRLEKRIVVAAGACLVHPKPGGLEQLTILWLSYCPVIVPPRQT